jgi:hypothetical protein
MAFNTPFKRWRRYEFNGGTADARIVSWPSAKAHPGAATGEGELRVAVEVTGDPHIDLEREAAAMVARE